MELTDQLLYISFGKNGPAYRGKLLINGPKHHKEANLGHPFLQLVVRHLWQIDFKVYTQWVMVAIGYQRLKE